MEHTRPNIILGASEEAKGAVLPVNYHGLVTIMTPVKLNIHEKSLVF
jgi:hypothetical protein